MRTLAGVTRHLGVHDDELRPLGAGFSGFLFALGGYFLLLPLRDEAGVALGTDKLPRLFVASLLLTFLATPLASLFLNRSASKERGLHLLFRTLALSVVGFLLLYLAAGSPAVQADHQEGTGHAAGDGTVPGPRLRPVQRHLLVAPGAVQLTAAQAAVRVAFFLWVSLLSLVTVSALWARSADVFNPEAAGRLFGLLGAGATLGQLLGSLAASALARAPLLQAGSGPSLLPLLVAAALLELAGQSAARYSAAGAAGSLRLADSEAGRQSGSPIQTDTAVLVRQGSSQMLRTSSKRALAASSSSSNFPNGAHGSKADSRLPEAAGSPTRKFGAGQHGGLLDQLLGRSLEGYRLIRASPYLMHVCLYLALNYITSSFFYFSKTLAVATVRDAASRTAWFATINSLSALFILGLQLLATGRLLRHMGLPLALSTLPALACLLMACIAAWPAPATVAAAEVVRKIVAYSLARPARESMFTVISREEKYKAKMFLDTVRIGDTLAAAAFQALVPSLGFGPSGMALACMPVCALWAVVAFRLGQRQQRLAAVMAAARAPA